MGRPEVLEHQTELEDLESPSLSFSQELQHRASLADDDPQLAQMYWYNLGHHQSDVEALLSCER